MATSSATALKWWLAVELRRLREVKNIRREHAAQAIMGSVQAIGHIETGRFLPKPLELDKLLELYGVPEQSAFFQDLRTRAKRGRDWWVHFGEAVRPDFDLFLGLESSAVRVETFDAIVLPGLFQTAAYAEAVVRGLSPEKSDAEVAEWVQLRMARQPRFLGVSEAPPVHAVIAEAALRLEVGGSGVMREQLVRLIGLRRHPNVQLQVLPATVGAHKAVDGSFTLLSAPPELRNYPGCVHVATLATDSYYEEPDQVTKYRNAVREVRARALSYAASIEFIDQLVREL